MFILLFPVKVVVIGKLSSIGVMENVERCVVLNSYLRTYEPIGIYTCTYY